MSKLGGAVRLCIEYRKLSNVTIPDNIPIPLIEDLRDRLGQSKIVSVLDFDKRYYQVPVHTNSVDKTWLLPTLMISTAKISKEEEKNVVMTMFNSIYKTIIIFISNTKVIIIFIMQACALVIIRQARGAYI